MDWGRERFKYFFLQGRDALGGDLHIVDHDDSFTAYRYCMGESEEYLRIQEMGKLGLGHGATVAW